MKELFQHAAITPVPSSEPGVGDAQVGTTENAITVRVAVNFLPEQSQPRTADQAGKWFWVYHIRLENGSDETVQLLTRHWRITDGRGTVNLVEGDGVVGEQPVLAPGQSHDYVSGCPLATPMGTMEGHYTFVRQSGDHFAVKIPFFPLAAPATAG